ncbi:MAG: AAA-like domain-containing protein [Chloroflexota bacterium]
MRRFHSYGPVNRDHHFAVERHKLVEQGVNQLIGVSDEGGHYFTIWAPRQTGKTWLLRQVTQRIQEHYPEEMTVLHFSLGGLRGMRFTLGETENDFPERLGGLLETALPSQPKVTSWKEFYNLFAKTDGSFGGLWDRPLILLIDEVDTIPPDLLDLMVGQFRELFLYRENNWLHGLALVGVRAVVGVDSKRGSPFNVQRSLRVTNFTLAEVQDLYQQYEDESDQAIESAVVEAIYTDTNGQPGLVCWLGELLTEQYNPGRDQTIDQETWELVSHKARNVEPNNTVLNLIAKARETENQNFLLQLFTHSGLPFAFHDPLLNTLYMHGLITSQTVRQANGELAEFCRFSSPFIQDTLYHALGSDLVGYGVPMLALDPLDDLADVFAQPATLDLSALLRRYKEYLVRQKARGVNPWKEQPRRQTDLHLTEAVGHFHLYAWLQTAIGHRCIVSPEFPTGNGQVDLHIGCGDQKGIIEVKSFVNQYQAQHDRKQAARYGKRMGLDQVTMAVFIPVEDEKVLEALSVTEFIDGVTVKMVAIGWV